MNLSIADLLMSSEFWCTSIIKAERTLPPIILAKQVIQVVVAKFSVIKSFQLSEQLEENTVFSFCP